MKLLLALSIALCRATQSGPVIEQCGTDMTKQQKDQCKAVNGANWAAPSCTMETHACEQSEEDVCSFKCIKKEDCKGNIETTQLGKDGYVCNCVKHDPKRFAFVWSCDNTPISVNASETQHQYGFARIPDINRDPSMNDDRKITILHKDHTKKLREGFERDNSIDFFSESKDTCNGTKATNPDDGLVYYEFSNIFNHPECAADCKYETRNQTFYQVCTTLIGYDDLIFTMPGTNTTAKVESGEFWELSCSTKLQDVVFDFGAVQNGDNQITQKNGTTEEIDFSLDIMCCDPEDENCNQCTKINDTLPIIKIGPKSKADSRFFIQAKMDTKGRENLGYFHIESAIYQGYGHNKELLETYPMIEDGCDVNPLIEFKERTKKQSDSFYLTPFKLDGEKYADEFRITAVVSACPLGPSASGECEFYADCDEKRYANQTWYPEPNGVTARRRRRDTTKAQTQTKVQTIEVYHPCKFVSQEKPYCFSDDNGEEVCWTKDQCDGRSSGDETETEVSGADVNAVMVSMFIPLLTLFAF